MADKEAALPGNAPGKFYVDDTCIDCDDCRSTAPKNIKRLDDDEYSVFGKQPENDEEMQACKDAMEACPVEAIGDDGDQ